MKVDKVSPANEIDATVSRLNVRFAKVRVEEQED